SWAIASGWWSGHGAAHYARRYASRAAFRSHSRPLGEAGLRPSGSTRVNLRAGDVIAAVQAEVLPLEKNYFREGGRLERSREMLDTLWSDVRQHLGSGDRREQLANREAAAIAAAGRWSLNAALARQESRGMHRRADFKATDPAFRRPVLVSGVDAIIVENPAADERREAVS
ncbi:MAG TPA: oxidoreductase, partial [Alphaproteobacteria bacterium]|nr:oxidoreductase [Alphaproteobacteria bacterium]